MDVQLSQMGPEKWHVRVDAVVTSEAEANELKARFKAAAANKRPDRRFPFPDATNEMSGKQQLKECVEFARLHKRVSGSPALFAVLVAIRVGVMTYTTGQWRGGLDLVKAAGHEISAGEVSKAAQVIRAELPHLMSRDVPVEEALRELSVWIYHHNWTDTYLELKGKK